MGNIRKAITLTDQQDRWIKAQATAGNFDDGGYIREPIRRDQEQYAKFQVLKAAIQEGLDSGVSDKAIPVIMEEVEARLRDDGRTHILGLRAFGSPLLTEQIIGRGLRQGKIVLVQYRGAADPDTGGSYTVKRYSSEKVAAEGGDWRHARIVLSPTNPQYEPIVFSPEESGHVEVIAEMVTVLRGGL